MLRRLFIRDFVIIDRLELEFEAGFSALTGETGAGQVHPRRCPGPGPGERADATCSARRERAEVAAE
jgi:DNA repair protein RecN (Recombination protein N)